MLSLTFFSRPVSCAEDVMDLAEKKVVVLYIEWMMIVMIESGKICLCNKNCCFISSDLNHSQLIFSPHFVSSWVRLCINSAGACRDNSNSPNKGLWEYYMNKITISCVTCFIFVGFSLERGCPGRWVKRAPLTSSRAISVRCLLGCDTNENIIRISCTV